MADSGFERWGADAAGKTIPPKRHRPLAMVTALLLGGQ
jgi:hypothetical protein